MKLKPRGLNNIYTATVNAHHDLVTIAGENSASLIGQEITFNDIDLAGHVYNGVYQDYFDLYEKPVTSLVLRAY